MWAFILMRKILHEVVGLSTSLRGSSTLILFCGVLRGLSLGLRRDGSNSFVVSLDVGNFPQSLAPTLKGTLSVGKKKRLIT